MRRQLVVPPNSGPVPSMVEWALALGRGVRRGMIRAVAIVTMLVIYAVTSLGSIGTSVLGTAGISSAALLATTAPAEARRRGRRRGRRRYRHRRHRGYYWGGPWYWGDSWRWRRRRRYRRRHGFGLYFRF